MSFSTIDINKSLFRSVYLADQDSTRDIYQCATKREIYSIVIYKPTSQQPEGCIELSCSAMRNPSIKSIRNIYSGPGTVTGWSQLERHLYNNFTDVY